MSKLSTFIAVIVVLLIAVGAVPIILNNVYVKYTPIVSTGGATPRLEKSEKLNTPAHQECMKIVLSHYGEEYKMSPDGRLLILLKLSLDREQLWNYTTKAQDEKFIKNLSL